jgi:NAD(P)-dependent dehydrogenase (short-subunit alcohol dehydrogenase family)
MMDKCLSGKVALVTGAGSGIGRATALLYALHGARVAVSDIDEAASNRAVAAIKEQGGEAFFVKANVADAEECQAMVARVAETCGRLDVACNNAGVAGEFTSISQTKIEDWHRVIDVNLNGMFHVLKYELEVMMRQGSGAIVNMASILGMAGFASSGAYVAAKHGVVGLTKTAALECANKGIRVNAVAPGFIDTPFFDGINPRSKQMLERMHPVPRLGQPEEVAELILWLSSEKASFVTGGIYPVDGAYLAR